MTTIAPVSGVLAPGTANVGVGIIEPGAAAQQSFQEALHRPVTTLQMEPGQAVDRLGGKVMEWVETAYDRVQRNAVPELGTASAPATSEAGSPSNGGAQQAAEKPDAAHQALQMLEHAFSFAIQATLISKIATESNSDLQHLSERAMRMVHAERKRQRAVRGRGLNIVLLLGLALALTGCKGDLYSRLSEKEANLIIALLLRSGIAADRLEAKDGSNTVRVEQERFADAVTLLNASGLPHAKFEDMGSVFSGNGLVSSPTEERARLVHALNQELARTITEIDGVISARVHVVLPKNDPLRHDQVPSAASVFIKHDARAEISALLPQIKTLIANSVEGLTYDKVAVVFVRGNPEPVEFSPSMSIETTASLTSRGGQPGYGDRLLLEVSAAVGAGLLGSVGLFWLWRRRARAGDAPGGAPLRRETGTRLRDPLRVVS